MEDINTNIEHIINTNIDINLLKLHQELVNANNTVLGFAQQGENIKIQLSVEPSETLKTLLSTIVNDHDSFNIEQERETAVEDINDHYQTVLASGYTYENVVLSISEASQNRYTALVGMSNSLPYPVYIPDLTSMGVLVLDSASDLQSMYGSLFVHCMGIFGAHSGSIAAINVATTQAAIDDIVNGYIGS